MVVMKHWSRILAWIAILLCSGSWALAQKTGSIPDGIDLVVLIDHSGSMWGWKDVVGDYKSDPYSHRISGVQRIFKRLLDDVEGSPRVHQVSVVEFGNEAKTVLSGLEIKYTRGATWRLEYESRFAAVQSQTLKNTNTAAAFENAAVEMDKLVTRYPSKERRKIVCLLTDGRPAMPKISKESLQERIIQSFGKMSLQGAELWILAIDAQLGYWDGKEEVFWKALTPRERAVKADPVMPNLPKLFNDFADDWLGSKTIQVEGRSVFCPPYLRQLKISVTLDQETDQVEVVGPDGRKIPGKRKSSKDKNLYFEVLNPKPGEYRIESDPGKKLSIRQEPVPHTLVRVSPQGPVDPGMPVSLKFELRDDAGKPILKDPGFPIQTIFDVTSPDGEVQELPEPIPHKSEAVFEAEWTPERMGSWQVKPKGIVTLPDGKTVDIFAALPMDASNQLEVTNRLPLKLRLKKPTPKRGFRVLPGTQTADLRIEVLDEQGKPLSQVEEVVREPETWLRVQVVDKNGAAIGEIVAMEYKPEGYFVATIPLEVDWKKGKGTLFPGKVHLVFQPAAERLDEERYLHSLWLPDSMAASRIAGNPLSVQALPVGMPAWLWFLFWVVLGLLAIPCGKFLFQRLVPNWATARRDMRQNQRLVLVVYDEVANPSAIGVQPISLGGKAFHKLDSKITVDIDGDVKRADRFRVKRTRLGTREAAKIEYRWVGEKKGRQGLHRGLVKLGQPTRLAGLAGKNYAIALKDQNK